MDLSNLHSVRELTELREQVLLMGARVESMVQASVRALIERDVGLAARTVAQDTHVNRLEMIVDEQCLRVLALRKPLATDLRFVAAVMKLVTHLERMADMAKNVCRRIVELDTVRGVRINAALSRLAQAALRLAEEALDAFTQNDAVRARSVIGRDRYVDACYAQCFPELMGIVALDAAQIGTAVRLEDIAKAFERIGDHATNIAEMVVFIVEGNDVRHIDVVDAGDNVVMLRPRRL
jgi:phosphate transport system protein